MIFQDFILGETTKENIIELYNGFIDELKNNPNLLIEKIDANDIFLTFAEPKEETRRYDVDAKETKNNFLKDNDSNELGDSLVRYGSYWPLLGSHSNSNKPKFSLRKKKIQYKDNYLILEGFHRAKAIKKIIADLDMTEKYYFKAITIREIGEAEELSTFKIINNKTFPKISESFPFLYLSNNKITYDDNDSLFCTIEISEKNIKYNRSSIYSNFLNLYGVTLNNYIHKFNILPIELEGNDFINSDLRCEHFRREYFEKIKMQNDKK